MGKGPGYARAILESAERLNERKNSYAVAREAVKNEYELMLREKELANEREQAELRLVRSNGRPV